MRSGAWTRTHESSTGHSGPASGGRPRRCRLPRRTARSRRLLRRRRLLRDLRVRDREHVAARVGRDGTDPISRVLHSTVQASHAGALARGRQHRDRVRSGSVTARSSAERCEKRPRRHVPGCQLGDRRKYRRVLRRPRCDQPASPHMLAASLWLATGSTPFSRLLPVVGTVLLIFGGTHTPNVVTRALAARPMVKVGDWSYSIYLWHWPCIVFAVVLWPTASHAGAIAAGVSLVPALASYAFVE